MTFWAALAAATGALALSGCQTTHTAATYVKLAPGPAVETAIAECKTISAKARHIVIGIGGPEMIVAGLIGTAVATGVRQAHVFEQCMAAQGYGKAGAKPAAAGGATPPPAAPGKAGPVRGKPKPAPRQRAPERPKTTAEPSPTA